MHYIPLHMFPSHVFSLIEDKIAFYKMRPNPVPKFQPLPFENTLLMGPYINLCSHTQYQIIPSYVF